MSRHALMTGLLLLSALQLVSLRVVYGHHRGASDLAKLADSEPDQAYDQKEEDFIRTPPGFEGPGKRKQAKGPEAGSIRVRIVDHATGKTTACRVNVVGPDGNFYEPLGHRLEGFSAHRMGCHLYEETHPPSRYYGWHFYTTGEFEVRVPAGDGANRSLERVRVWPR